MVAASASPAASPGVVREGSGSGRRSPARRPPPRKQRPSPEDLEAHYRELEAFKKEEERRKKDAEKAHKQLGIQEKRNVNRALQQAQREANSRQAEVDRLLRQLEKCEHEQERHSARKFAQQERLDDALRKLREERYLVSQQYEHKLADAGEARGRLELIEGVLTTEGDEEEADEDETEEDGMERAQQVLIKAEMSQMRTRISYLTNDNGRMRKELTDLRRAVAFRSGALSTAGMVINEPIEVRAPAGSARQPSSSPVRGATGGVASPFPAAFVSTTAIGSGPVRSWSTPGLPPSQGGGSFVMPLQQQPAGSWQPGTPLQPQPLQPVGSWQPVPSLQSQPLIARTATQPEQGLVQSQPLISRTSAPAAGSAARAAVGSQALIQSQPSLSTVQGAHKGWAHLQSSVAHTRPMEDSDSRDGESLYQIVKDVTNEALRDYQQANRSPSNRAAAC